MRPGSHSPVHRLRSPRGVQPLHAPARLGWLRPLGLVAALVVALQSVHPADTASPASLFDEANRLYEKGQYPEAITGYTRLLDAGRTSAALTFNLGNACFKAGQLGRALWYYRQAELLDPRDPDIQANLRLARARVQGGPPAPPPLWRRALPRLTLDQWTLLAACLGWTLLGGWSARHLQPQWRPRLKLPLILLACALGASAIGLLLAWSDQRLTRHAVVIQRDTILRHGPLDESPSLQTLPDGQELVVLDRKDDWYQVSGATRGVGWLKTNEVALLRR